MVQSDRVTSILTSDWLKIERIEPEPGDAEIFTTRAKIENLKCFKSNAEIEKPFIS